MKPAMTIRVDCLKLEYFDETNFNAWRHKVIFGMQLLKIYYVISEEKEEAHNVNHVNNFVAMLFQVTSPSNNSNWWLDTGATCHVCSNKNLFSTYVAAKENVSMANHSTVALRTATAVLILTSAKTLTLRCVKHILSIFKNLVSDSLLCDVGMRLDFQVGKVVLSYKKIF